MKRLDMCLAISSQGKINMQYERIDRRKEVMMGKKSWVNIWMDERISLSAEM